MPNTASLAQSCHKRQTLMGQIVTDEPKYWVLIKQSCHWLSHYRLVN